LGSKGVRRLLALVIAGLALQCRARKSTGTDSAGDQQATGRAIAARGGFDGGSLVEAKRENAALRAELFKLRALGGGGGVSGGGGGGLTRPRPLPPHSSMASSAGSPTEVAGPTPGEVFARMRGAMDVRFERVMDTFKRMDTSSDGSITKTELRRGLALLGFKPRGGGVLMGAEEVAVVFAALDRDGSDSVDYRELARALDGAGADVDVRVN
jgi:Ca2+-binding EF-hand superfamily protein